MPTYEYGCEDCKKSWEEVQKMSDPAIEQCPSCGGKAKKLISLSSFAFKGTGFYTTDYKRPAASEGSKSS